MVSQNLFCMVRKYFILLLIFLVAAIKGMAEENDSVKYVIQGTAPYNMEGKQVRISYSDSKGSHILCTSTVKKGKFSMQGVIPEPVIASIEIADQNLSNNLIALDGHPLKITTSYVDFKVIGGENNVRLLTFQKLENEFMDNLYRGLSQESSAEKIKQFVFTNADNLVGGYVFGRFNDFFTPEETDSLFEKTGDDFLTDEQARIAFMKNEAGKAREVGSMFTDVELEKGDDYDVRLSYVVSKNQYTLLYFWATTNPNCLPHIPLIKQMYDSYHEKGFEVVAFSVDEQTEKWEKYVETHGILDWLHVNNPAGGAAQVYGLMDWNNLPYFILIDKDGKIVVSDKKIDAVKETLMQHFGPITAQEEQKPEVLPKEKHPVTYHIVGTLPPTLNGKEVRLYTKSNDIHAVDSAFVKKGRFEFRGSGEYADLSHIYVRGGSFAEQKYFLLEEGTTTITYSDKRFHVKGGKLNNAYEEVADSVEILNRQGMSQEEITKLSEEYQNVNTSSERREQIARIMQEHDRQQIQFVTRFIKRNNDNVVGAMLYDQYSGLLDEEERRSILKSAGKEFLDYLQELEKDMLQRSVQHQ